MSQEQIVNMIGTVRANGTTILAPNGNTLTISEGIVLIDDKLAVHGGTIFKPDDVRKFVNSWIEQNR
jgi:hypothetical protein